MWCLTAAAGDASEAPAIIDEGEEIDPLFTDVMMPGSINGRQLARSMAPRAFAQDIVHIRPFGKRHGARRHLDAGVLMLAERSRKMDLTKITRTALAA